MIGRKKNELIKQMMQKIEEIKSGYQVADAPLLAAVGINICTFKRWKRRICAGADPVQKPGAKKVAPIDLGKLEQQIAGLNHGKKRTAGTGRLYRANSNGISRREFNQMVAQARSEAKREKVGMRCTVRWLKPNLAWAFDGLQYTSCHVQNLQDLCSRYKFAPMTTGYMPCGEEVAGHLERHLNRFGPPLFIKRDNGHNLNHRAVNDLLGDRMVIPINSPCNSPAYNGAIEHSVGELKGWLRKWKAAVKTIRELALAVENAANALNHRSRRCLYGKNACRSYFAPSRLRYSKRKRRQAYEWISNLAVDISAACGKNNIDPSAFRIAARKWMEKHGLIVVQKPVKVLPHFF